MKRSSRSGSLVNTPDHQPKRTSVPATPYIFDDDVDSGNYLVAMGDSSTTNSTSSFDATVDMTPDVPPVPPRISNPPRNSRSEQLIIIDTDDVIDAPPPIPFARTKPKFQTPMTKPTNLLPILETRSNTCSVHKHNGINRTPPPPPQFIEPQPPPSSNHKLNMTNESNLSEVRRRISHHIIPFSHLNFFYHLIFSCTSKSFTHIYVLFFFYSLIIMCDLSFLWLFSLYISVCFGQKIEIR